MHDFYGKPVPVAHPVAFAEHLKAQSLLAVLEVDGRPDVVAKPCWNTANSTGRLVHKSTPQLLLFVPEETKYKPAAGMTQEEALQVGVDPALTPETV